MKFNLLLLFLSLALCSNAQTDKSNEPYFRVGVLGNFYLSKREDDETRTYSDGTTETTSDTTELTSGGLGLFSTLGYAFGNQLHVGIEGRAHIYRDDTYFIGLFVMTSFGGVVEYEFSEPLTLYGKFNWNFDYLFKGTEDRRSYSFGGGAYIGLPDYPMARVRLNLEYMISGGRFFNNYSYDPSQGGVQLLQRDNPVRYRGLLAEIGISVGI